MNRVLPNTADALQARTHATSDLRTDSTGRRDANGLGDGLPPGRQQDVRHSGRYAGVSETKGRDDTRVANRSGRQGGANTGANVPTGQVQERTGADVTDVGAEKTTHAGNIGGTEGHASPAGVEYYQPQEV